MLYDNSSPETSVHTWISEQTSKGKMDVTTGYFTVGILAKISRELNEKISEFRFVIGDIASTGEDKEKPINLLTETITVDAALRLNALAKEAVQFLNQENVKCHTVEPNFCHAKSILFRAAKTPNSYYVTGSSNLTEAGLGLQPTSNIELNIVGQGTAPDYVQICHWFDELWSHNRTQAYKTVEGKRVSFKKYLIEQIGAIFRQYTPRELYYKTLFELFKDQMADLDTDPQFQQNIGHLKHSKIYQALYDFQQKGVLSLIKKIETYNGAILADAVGLGKTWSALAVMKYFEIKGHESILLCPKKLSTNWQRYQSKRGSIFDSDKLDYVIRYHTDMQDNRIETNHDDGYRLDSFFQSDKPKLFIIDESHNFRNQKSGRYQYLVENLLKANPTAKVLLLSATPINNDFKDIRNQFALLVKGDDAGFQDAPGILVGSIEDKFRLASKAFNEWSLEENRNIRTLIEKLPDEVIRMMDHLLVARTRKHIKGLTDNLTFPEMRPPQNEYLDSLNISEYAKFEDILTALPSYFAAYKPAVYSEQANVSGNALKDETLRDQFLVVMLNKLLVKRLESSWLAFHKTLQTVRGVHARTLTAVLNYLENQSDSSIGGDDLQVFGDEIDMPIGKREIRLSEIEAAGNLERFKEHLQQDVDDLDQLIEKIHVYAAQIETETESTSQDAKLARLIELIEAQHQEAETPENRKLLLFTSYKDTAEYIFRELTKRGFQKMACISGDGAMTSEAPDNYQRQFEPILERFCPYTKLYRERDWPEFENKDLGSEAFNRWKDWVAPQKDTIRQQLENPIEIVIATDCLSEGQNLQDCDTVVNYDIHWNPVRVIQRLGRIDRIGSPNTHVRGINFWPAPNMNEYLGLQRRVEDRAVAIASAGAEVPRLNATVDERLSDLQFEEQQEAQMLRHMDSTWEDLEASGDNLNFADLSLEFFRQDLIKELSNNHKHYDAMPLGVYSGFATEFENTRPGLVALLGYPSRKNGSRTAYQRHNLVYIDMHGQAIYDKPGEVLKFLADHQSEDRLVPEGLDDNEDAAITQHADAIKNWLKSFSAGDALDDLLSGIQGGDLKAHQQIADDNTLEAQYDPENCDLILWFTVTA
jgi:superfamily II DNA or RNA helicase